MPLFVWDYVHRKQQIRANTLYSPLLVTTRIPRGWNKDGVLPPQMAEVGAMNLVGRDEGIARGSYIASSPLITAPYGWQPRKIRGVRIALVPGRPKQGVVEALWSLGESPHRPNRILFVCPRIADLAFVHIRCYNLYTKIKIEFRNEQFFGTRSDLYR